jgi:hypothetical protein
MVFAWQVSAVLTPHSGTGHGKPLTFPTTTTTTAHSGIWSSPQALGPDYGLNVTCKWDDTSSTKIDAIPVSKMQAQQAEAAKVGDGMLALLGTTRVTVAMHPPCLVFPVHEDAASGVRSINDALKSWSDAGSTTPMREAAHLQCHARCAHPQAAAARAASRSPPPTTASSAGAPAAAYAGAGAGAGIGSGVAPGTAATFTGALRASASSSSADEAGSGLTSMDHDSRS